MSSESIQFINQLSSMLICQNEPAQFFASTCRMIGQHLQVDRCFMGECEPGRNDIRIHPDYHPGLPSMQGDHRLETFPPLFHINLSQNQPLVVRDVHLDPVTAAYGKLFENLMVRALVVIPFIRNGSWSASLMAAHAAPYAWSEAEIALLRSASDLAWLSAENMRLNQRAQLAEENLRLAAINSALTLYHNDLDLCYTWVYSPAQQRADEVIGKKDSDIYPEQEAIFLTAIKRRALETGVGAHLEYEMHSPSGARWYDMSIEPRYSDGAVSGLTVVAFDITERHQAEEEARTSIAHLETSRLILHDCEAKRMNLAQTLHDGPLQTAMGLSMELKDALDTNERPERLERMNAIRARMQILANDLRNTCVELRPPTLAPFGLEQAIRSHLETFQAEHPELSIHPELMPDGQSLTEEIRQVLFRNYQELLDNVVQHANASQVSIHLTLDEAQAELEIQDNGQGFILPNDWLDFARKGRYGLAGIGERAELLNGRAFIRSAPGKGTLVRVVIPRSVPASRVDL